MAKCLICGEADAQTKREPAASPFVTVTCPGDNPCGTYQIDDFSRDEIEKLTEPHSSSFRASASKSIGSANVRNNILLLDEETIRQLSMTAPAAR